MLAVSSTFFFLKGKRVKHFFQMFIGAFFFSNSCVNCFYSIFLQIPCFILWLAFSHPPEIFCWIYVLNFNIIKFIFSFMLCTLVLYFYNLCAPQGHENIPLCFSEIFSFAFHIHIPNSLEMIFAYGVGKLKFSIIIIIWKLNYPSTICLNKLPFLICHKLSIPLLVINQVSIYAWV